MLPSHWLTNYFNVSGGKRNFVKNRRARIKTTIMFVID